ncbi:hypothetical protein HY492_03955 [Candidatus Woesearchaeota archaeon]|nr:hypothetical protein [Candidatus Woesearchaeota archaeon]
MTSFDAIGTVAIMEHGTKQSAKAFLARHPFFTAVYRKTGMHAGKYRVQKLVFLAGKRAMVVEHKESGLRMRVNVAKTYFSPRLSSERLRIAQLVKPGEKVLVLFGGVAPYALVLAKHTKAGHITSVELNPVAHKQAEENLVLNRLSHKITVIKADAKRWCLRTKERFDRVIMPLPLTAATFVPAALKVCKPKATIHFYTFAHDTAFNRAADPLVPACVKAKKQCVVQRVVKVGQSSPHVYRVSVDVVIRSRRFA